LSVRRETGKEWMVKVHHGEGVVTHTGPEPCVGIREGAGEASVGERIGQPLSREIRIVLGADAFDNAEGNTGGRANTSARTTRRGRRTWHVQTLFAREPGGLASGQGAAALFGPHRKGEEP
jgi:hypothetical protein